MFAVGKTAYVKRLENRAEGECILCAIADGESEIPQLDVARSDLFVITLNLYPYNPGHIMLFPARHVEDVRDYNDAEWSEFRRLEDAALDVLTEVYEPKGFNIGYNIGPASGASIPHLHLHIVPRYPNEVGVMDILSGSRVIVEDPNITRERLSDAFARRLG
ncbi:MAG: HIT domain-containing protein [Candidatus Coatesbacteria bacterium]|nr:MAG: HIT domain-containing protein [Candidatus Coatesbacteria bacterium]